MTNFSRRHQLSHQAPDLHCPFPGCDKVFHRRDLLERHQQRQLVNTLSHHCQLLFLTNSNSEQEAQHGRVSHLQDTPPFTPAGGAQGYDVAPQLNPNFFPGTSPNIQGSSDNGRWDPSQNQDGHHPATGGSGGLPPGTADFSGIDHGQPPNSYHHIPPAHTSIRVETMATLRPPVDGPRVLAEPSHLAYSDTQINQPRILPRQKSPADSTSATDSIYSTSPSDSRSAFSAIAPIHERQPLAPSFDALPRAFRNSVSNASNLTWNMGYAGSPPPIYPQYEEALEFSGLSRQTSDSIRSHSLMNATVRSLSSPSMTGFQSSEAVLTASSPAPHSMALACRDLLGRTLGGSQDDMLLTLTSEAVDCSTFLPQHILGKVFIHFAP